MSIEIIIVLLSLVAMLTALIMDKMRPGMILFSVVVIFLCTGILTPKEMLEGFSNKGMITVAMLFLVSEGVRQSGALTQLIKKLLPQEKTSVFKAQIRSVAQHCLHFGLSEQHTGCSHFCPIIKRWANYVKLPATYSDTSFVCNNFRRYLYPDRTSTNLVVHSMILDAGMKGFSMFELGKVGIFIALAGIIYLFLFSKKLLPATRPETTNEEDGDSSLHLVEAVIGPRFPGINKTVGEFDFKRHYGAEIKELRRSGRTYTNLSEVSFREGDTLVVLTDDSFIQTWGESSVFLMLANGKEYEPAGKKKRWFTLFLLLFMIVGATVGELPGIEKYLPEGIKLDMFFFVSITTVIMAWSKIFPPQKYTKYISWDILITIACAFAISKAMENSGVADLLAGYIISLSHDYGPYVLLAVLFIITNIFTELITNNARPHWLSPSPCPCPPS